MTDRSAYPAKASGPQQGWGAYFDENFDLYMHDWSDDAAGGVWRIPVARWTPHRRCTSGGRPARRFAVGHGLWTAPAGPAAALDHDGAVYAFNGGYNAAQLPGVGHGHDWEFAQITRYDARTGCRCGMRRARPPGSSPQASTTARPAPAGVIGDYLSGPMKTA